MSIKITNPDVVAVPAHAEPKQKVEATLRENGNYYNIVVFNLPARVGDKGKVWTVKFEKDVPRLGFYKGKLYKKLSGPFPTNGSAQEERFRQDFKNIQSDVLDQKDAVDIEKSFVE